MEVMVVNPYHENYLQALEIDYFHGAVYGIPMCEACLPALRHSTDEMEVDAAANELIAIRWGPALRFCILLQRQWRRWRSRYTRKWMLDVERLCFAQKPAKIIRPHWFIHVAPFLSAGK